jgi:hypothetical protein
MEYKVGQEFSAGELTFCIKSVLPVTKNFSRITFQFIAKSVFSGWDFCCGSDELDRLLSSGGISLIEEEWMKE